MRKIPLMAMASGLALALAASAAAAQSAQTSPRTAAPAVEDSVSRADMLARRHEMFVRLDANRDGRVTREEAAQAREKMRSEMRDRVFAALDKDGNGQISRQEFASRPDRDGPHRMGQGRGGHGGKGWRHGRRGGGMGAPGAMLDRFDADKDGAVTEQEFNARFDERFARMDRNNDGVIGRDERRLHHGPRHGGDGAAR